MNKKVFRMLFIGLIFLFLATTGYAISGIVCSIISSIHAALIPIGGGLVTLMFIYGGVSYVFNADNPGGRKKARDILIHAIIGGVIIVVASNIVGLIAGLTKCPGM
ncbi:MAG: hypothetical protein GF334_10850 [Candidatus Altiarchaeales archaeon]|nr:hypothetical protein [Candidatus Altiarchaeales archaeon]